MIAPHDFTRVPFAKPFGVLRAELQGESCPLHFDTVRFLRDFAGHALPTPEAREARNARLVARWRREVESEGFAVVTVDRLQSFRETAGECESEEAA